MMNMEEHSALKGWTRYNGKIKDECEAERHILHLMNIDYSIHYHA